MQVLTYPRITAANIGSLALSKGSHESHNEGNCFMEVVAMLNGERFSDDPP